MKHLVLSGGGVKGLAFIGAYKKLEHLLKKLESVTVVSVGAIFGMLIIAGYTAKEMETIVLEKDVSTLKKIKLTNLI